MRFLGSAPKKKKKKKKKKIFVFRVLDESEVLEEEYSCGGRYFKVLSSLTIGNECEVICLLNGISLTVIV